MQNLYLVISFAVGMVVLALTGCDVLDAKAPRQDTRILWGRSIGEVEILVFDLLGRRVLRSTASSWPRCSLTATRWSSGMYVVQVIHRGDRATVETFTVVK